MALNGSSMRSTGGSAVSARATPTRCCWPPESWLGYRVAHCRRQADQGHEILLLGAALTTREVPNSRGTVEMLSRTVRWGPRYVH